MTMGYVVAYAREHFWLLFRYGVSGAFGAFVQTFFLYLWVSVLGLEGTYLLGAFLGFCLALIVTFALQKFWTFRDHALHRTQKQLFWYSMVAVLNVTLNIVLLAFAKEIFALFHIEFFRFWYLVVQGAIVIFASGVSFFLNYFFTFHDTNHVRVAARIRVWLTVSEAPFLLALALITIAVFAPYLLGGMMSANEEQLGGFYQYSLFYSRAIAEGQSFLFDPNAYGGDLSYINQFGAFLFPPVYVFFSLFPLLIAFYLAIALAVFGGLAFAYLFGRIMGLSRPASFVLALTYATAQSATIFGSGLSFAHSFFVLPLLLYCLVKVKKATSTRSLVGYLALGGVGVGVGFLAGNFVTFFFTLLFVGMFALFLDFFGDRVGYARDYRATLSLTGMGVLGALIGSPQIIALYEYAPFTSRTAEYASEGAGSGVVLGDFIHALLPYNFSIPIPGSSGVAFLYYGFVPLTCILLAAFFFSHNVFVAFFFILFAFFAAFAMNLPGFEWINTHVPPFNRIGGMNKWFLVGAFAPAYLAGYGFDRLAALGTTRALARFWQVFRAVSLIGVGLLALLQFALSFLASSAPVKQWIFMKVLVSNGRSLESLKHPTAYYTDTIGRELNRIHDTFSFSNPYFGIFLVLILLGILAIQYLIRTGPTRRAKSFVVLAVLGTFFASFAADILYYVAPVGSYFTLPPAVARVMLDRDPSPRTYRFATFKGDELWRNLDEAGIRFTPQNVARTTRELLLLNAGSAYGLETIAGHNPLFSLRQNQLIYAALEQHQDLAINLDLIKNGAPITHYSHSAIVTSVTPEEKAKDIEKRIPLLSMMNVKYIISLYPLEDKRLEEVKSFSLPDLHVDYTLYENKTVLPRLYFAANPVIWEGSERDLFIAMLENPNFSKKTFIECADCAAIPGKGTVSVFHTENGLLQATTTSTTPGWLVYSASALPGWIAKIDGERVPIKTANYLFQAIEIPQGEHTVEFRYAGSFTLFLEKVGIFKL